MVHSAYDAAELIPGCLRMAHRAVPDRLRRHVWLQDPPWHLCIYASSTSSDDSDDGDVRRVPYVVDREVRGFWKRSPAEMEVCGWRELLLSLLESIAFHRLPNLEAVATIAKTKEANTYGWDDRRGLLCVTRPKRITIFRHDSNVPRTNFCDGRFVDQHEQLLLEHVGGGLSL